MKSKALFYILSFTWGLPMTLVGLIVAAVLICTGHKPKRWGCCIYFNVGKSWGGVSLGIVFVTDSRDVERTKWHEHGHSLNNTWFGVFMVFISIASAIRYWYREIRTRLGLKNNTPYDGVWYEKLATDCGEKYCKRWWGKK